MCDALHIFIFLSRKNIRDTTLHSCANSFCLARRFCNGSTLYAFIYGTSSSSTTNAEYSRFYIIEWRSSIFFSFLLFFFCFFFGAEIYIIKELLYNCRKKYRKTHDIPTQYLSVVSVRV